MSGTQRRQRKAEYSYVLPMLTPRRRLKISTLMSERRKKKAKKCMPLLTSSRSSLRTRRSDVIILRYGDIREPFPRVSTAITAGKHKTRLCLRIYYNNIIICRWVTSVCAMRKYRIIIIIICVLTKNRPAAHALALVPPICRRAAVHTLI